mgnify:CR=1 FL=1
MPNIYSTDAFEEEYTYTGDDLGAQWSPEATRFRVWAPTADEVFLNLYASGTPLSWSYLAFESFTPVTASSPYSLVYPSTPDYILTPDSPLELTREYKISYDGNEYKVTMPNIYSTDAFEEEY